MLRRPNPGWQLGPPCALVRSFSVFRTASRPPRFGCRSSTAARQGGECLRPPRDVRRIDTASRTVVGAPIPWWTVARVAEVRSGSAAAATRVAVPYPARGPAHGGSAAAASPGPDGLAPPPRACELLGPRWPQPLQQLRRLCPGRGPRHPPSSPSPMRGDRQLRSFRPSRELQGVRKSHAGRPIARQRRARGCVMRQRQYHPGIGVVH